MHYVDFYKGICKPATQATLDALKAPPPHLILPPVLLLSPDSSMPRLSAVCSAALLSQIDLDFNLDMLCTSGGAVFQLFVHGFSTMVVLRCSIGSCANIAHMLGGPKGERELNLVLKPAHNQSKLFSCLHTQLDPKKIIQSYRSGKDHSSVFRLVTSSQEVRA